MIGHTKIFDVEAMSSNCTFDTVTPGALIGRWVNFEKLKLMVIGDERLCGAVSTCPLLLLSSESTSHWVSSKDISPWIEPVVKQKVKRMKIFYKTDEDAVYETNWLRSIEQWRDMWGKNADKRIVHIEHREFEE